MGVMFGVFLAVTAGTINGLFALPMKAARKWAWENSWLPFSLLSLVVFPWLIAVALVPHLSDAYEHVSINNFLIAVLWGVAVYVGSLSFGISLVYIGTALAFALLVGAMSIVGVLLPIVIFKPQTLGLSGGKWILGGIVSLVLALILCTIAGRLKERAQAGEDTSGIGDKVKRSAVVGMVLAIIGGTLSGLLALGMEMNWAKAISHAAVRFGGATEAKAANAILALVLLGGAIPNTIYCIYLLFKNKTWKRYRKPKTKAYWLIIILMGGMYSGSLALWGMSTSESMLGELGPSVGWALFIGMIVISSNIGGFATGEWRNARGKPVNTMLGGLALIIVAMILIGYGNFLVSGGS